MLKVWTRWIVRSMLSILLISSLTVFANWRLMDIYMNRILDKIASSDDAASVIGRITQDRDGNMNSPPDDGRMVSSQGEEAAGTDVAVRDEAVLDDIADRANSTEMFDDHDLEEDQQVPKEATPVFGWDIDDQVLPGGDTEKWAMSAEEFALRQEQMTEEDKLAVLSLLFSRLPQHEVQNISYLLEDGLTVEESEEIYHILREYLEEEELQDLANMIRKYEF